MSRDFRGRLRPPLAEAHKELSAVWPKVESQAELLDCRLPAETGMV